MLLTLTLEIDSQSNLDLVTLHLISLYFMKMVYKGLDICLSTSIPSWSQREKWTLCWWPTSSAKYFWSFSAV